MAAVAAPLDPEVKTRLDTLTAEFRHGDPIV